MNERIHRSESPDSGKKILVVGDVSPDTDRIVRALESLASTTLASGTEALSLLDHIRPDLIVADDSVTDRGGPRILEELTSTRAATVSIVLSKCGTAADRRDGAATTVLPKPVDTGALHALASVALRCATAERSAHDLELENARLRGAVIDPEAKEPEDLEQYEGLLTCSAVMRRELRLLRKVEHMDTPVLIWGETGTGKQTMARAIHSRSRRAGTRFTPVNLGAISDQQQERDLFGHVRGAFPGAVENRSGILVETAGGTLLLDEISEASAAVQVAILQVLEEGIVTPLGSDQSRNVDVRVIATTTRNLEELVRTGHFRQDLYYRLNVFPLEMPPLRERREDIVVLARRFLAEASRAAGRTPPDLSREVRVALEGHRWEGNVRELRNVMERAAMLCKGRLLVPGDLPLALERAKADEKKEGGSTIIIPPSGASLHDLEREIFHKTLILTNGNQSRAARILGLRESTLRFRLRKLGIAPRRQTKSQSAAKLPSS